MQRVSTTVIGLVGDQARACAQALQRAPNIRVELPDPAAPPLERAATAWEAATGAHLPYLVHDADPLAAVADAWVRRYDQQGLAGELEVAVADTVARWRARTIELPDYYLVLDPESGRRPAATGTWACSPARPRPGWSRPTPPRPPASRRPSPPWPAAAGGRSWTGSWPTSTGWSRTGSEPGARRPSTRARFCRMLSLARWTPRTGEPP